MRKQLLSKKMLGLIVASTSIWLTACSNNDEPSSDKIMI